MPSNALVMPLMAGMIITGTSNSILNKWQDMQCVENCTDPDLTKRVLYEQPVWQTLQMFLGEMLCFLPVIYSWLRTRRQQTPVRLPSEEDDRTPKKPTAQRLQGWKVLILWLPALCDVTATTLMNVGLLYTPVSIYQMTRGALVLFVGILSVVFLRRRLWLYQWASLLTVMTGVSLVGYSGSLVKDAVKENVGDVLSRVIGDLSSPQGSDILQPGLAEKPEATKALIGVLFVLFAQVFAATQFVIEEKIMGRYSVPPLVAVGYEGLFGAITILLSIPILSIPAVSSKSTFFDLPRGWHQMVDTPAVLWCGIAIAFSIALFNFFGLSVTRHVSATARSLVDTCRTLSIWLISLLLGWEKIRFPISLLQVMGFSLLVYGTSLFNDLVRPPQFLRPPPTSETDEEEGERLLAETAILPADLGQTGFDVLPEGEHVITPKPTSS